jgi:hypothetical protein
MRRNKYKKQAPRSQSAAMVCPVSVSTADNEAGGKSATVVAFVSIEGCGILASSVVAQEYVSTDAARATSSNAKEAVFVNKADRRCSAGNAWRFTAHACTAWRFTAHACTARRETGTGSAETGALHLRTNKNLTQQHKIAHDISAAISAPHSGDVAQLSGILQRNIALPMYGLPQTALVSMNPLLMMPMLPAHLALQPRHEPPDDAGQPRRRQLCSATQLATRPTLAAAAIL